MTDTEYKEFVEAYCAINAEINHFEISHALPTAIGRIQLRDLYKARDAMKKQMPMVPVGKCYWEEAAYYTGCCPVCKAGANDNMYYCDECGQALKWTEEEP